MINNTQLGVEGEKAARAWLESRGYQIRDIRWHCGHLELDIVASKDGMLIVIEVKTRTSEQYGEPEEAVSERKIRRIVNAADGYIKFYRLDLPVRFDIMALIREPDGSYRVNHIEDAFMAPVR